MELSPYESLLLEEVFFIIQSIWQKYAKSFLLPGILIVSGLLYILLSNDASTNPQVELIENSKMSEQLSINSEMTEQPLEVPASAKQAASMVMVDVKGAVKQPGVYKLPTESRVIDAITLAGGYLEVADARLINHAQKIVDEMVIYVPMKGELLEEQVMENLVTVPASGSNHSENSPSNEGKVNINTADEATLMTLPGIGPSKAQAILIYRQENGQFKVVEDLKAVSGIGDKTFEKLVDLITVK